MKKAFTLIELLIAVVIIGILAAIVLPIFRENINKAKEAAAKDNLRIFRNAIELYTVRHKGVPPGYLDNNPSSIAGGINVLRQLVKGGDYLTKLPENPFNGKNTILAIRNDQDFPAEASGQYGWIYKPAAKTIRLDWPGTDSAGVAYFDY